MSQGLLYEPRSFWSIAYNGGSIIEPVQLDKRHFFNGERWPITIKRLAVAAVNYGYMDSQLIENFADGTSAFSNFEIAISVPQRYHLNTRRFVQSASIMPRPTYTPPTLPAAGQASSLWGQCMLKPDNPLYIPRMGSLDWALSSFTPWAGRQTSQTEEAHATLLYQEEGGLFAGSARTFDFDLQFMNQAALTQLLGVLASIDNGVDQIPERFPFLPGAVSLGGTPVVGGSPQWWPPEHNFDAKTFDEQESTRSGSTKITDLRTFIDQRDYDSELQQSELPDAQPTPLSLRVGTRIRSVNSGSKTWWWRPGAPLALVFDHITPANVYELPEEITLRPGEQLDVEVRYTGPQGVNAPSKMHLGVSLNGFASIEA